MEKKLSYSIRKFIRLEKNRIRSTVLDFKKQQELISQLYSKLSQFIKNKKDYGNLGKMVVNVKSQILITKPQINSKSKIQKNNHVKLKVKPKKHEK